MTSTTNSIITSNADGQFVDANSCFLNTNVSSAITSPVSSAPIPVITNSNSNNSSINNLDNSLNANNVNVNNQLIDLICKLNQTVKSLQSEISILREKVDSNIGNNVNIENNSNSNSNSNSNLNSVENNFSNTNSINNGQLNDLNFCAPQPIKIPSGLTPFPPFSPEEDIIVWIDKIESLNKVLRLTDESLIETICMHVDPKTFQWLKLQKVKNANLTWLQLKDAFKAKFDVGNKTKLLSQMYNRKQKQFEEINDFVIEKLTLINRANPLMDEIDKIQVIFDGLRADVQKCIANYNKNNLDEFIECLDKLNSAYKISNEKFKTKMQNKNQFKSNNFTNKNKPDFRHKHSSFENNNSKSNSNSTFANQSKEKPKKEPNLNKYKDKYCHNCFEKGHIKPYCPKPKHNVPVNMIGDILNEYSSKQNHINKNQNISLN